MHNTMDRLWIVLVGLLTIGACGLMLHHHEVGRYNVMLNNNDGAIYILDTATGTLKQTSLRRTYTGTWDREYLNGTITPAPPEDKK